MKNTFTSKRIHIFVLILTLLPMGQKAFSQEYATPELPTLSVKARDGKIYAGLGVTLRAVAGIDFGHVMSNSSDFVVSAIPMEQDKGNGALLSIGGQQTELTLTAGFNPGTKYAVKACVSGLFIGKNYAFQLENAWVSVLGIRAGYGYGVFCDNDAMPPTIDHQGPNAAISVNNGLIDYTHTIGDSWTLAVGLEQPLSAYNASRYTSAVNQRTPDIPISATYSNENVTFKAAFLWRGIQYRDNLADKNRTAHAYGASLSGYGNIVDGLQYRFQTTIGRGISSYYQDLNGLNLDLCPSINNSGKLSSIKSWGGYWGLGYNFSSKFTSSLTYSHLRIYPDAMPGSTYSYGQYACANFFWSFNSALQWGIEYIYGRRVNLDHSQAHDSRLHTMLAFTF